MKKYLLITTILSLILFDINFANADEQQDVCKIESSPSSELVGYYKTIETELSEISKNITKDSNYCDLGNYQKATSVFNAAYANIFTMKNLLTDFAYNTKFVFKGDSTSAVVRDEALFSKLEKKVENVSKELANKCALNTKNKGELMVIIKEINALHALYQQTAIGLFDSDSLDFENSSSDIRSDNVSIAKSIIANYNPSSVKKCSPVNKKPKTFSETLSEVFNFGSNKEKSLETWRRAAALFRSANSNDNSEEFISYQRKLLKDELSRQGLSPNMQQVIMSNFSCYKSKSSDVNNILDSAKIRAECLSIPVTGVSEILVDFNKFVWSSPNTDIFSARRDTLLASRHRSVDIVGMHSRLQAMLSSSQDIADTTRNNLISLHSSLVATNERLEERIPSAQKNCMKGQPDIVGGCR